MKTQPTKFAPGWYVIDQFATDNQPISGPFATREEAENDRQQWDCADDYFIAKPKSAAG